MKHEWSEAKPVYTNQEEGRARFLSFCYACGLLRLDAHSSRTGRTSVLFSMTGKGDTAISVEEPSCVPVANRRTLRARSKRAPAKEHAAALEQLEIVLLEREISFEQWRDLSGAQREVHIGRYLDGAKSNLYGPYPRTWCGVLLEDVTWSTIDLVREPTPRLWRDGDAVCVACIGETRRRDRRG
jgi:hypothetical protein